MWTPGVAARGQPDFARGRASTVHAMSPPRQVAGLGLRQADHGWVTLLCFLRIVVYPLVVRQMATDLLTTGQAAAMLGSSRQHVVDLCTSGRLPYQVVGSHRRVRRSDVMRLLDGASLTRDQQRSLWLHRVVAGKVALDPARAIALARRNLRRLRSQHPEGGVTADFDEWEGLLDGPIEVLLATLVSPSQRAVELRQNSPFAGVLTERERAKALAAFRAATRVA